MGILGGTFAQKALFIGLITIYAIALALSAQDKLTRVGHPDIGWVADFGGTVSPSRLDASEMGLRGGGRALSINGVPVTPLGFEGQSARLADWQLGASNTIRFQRWGQVRELVIPVRDWTWQDAIFTHGLIDALALLFVATALTSFALRPYEPTSWAILSLATVTGSLLTVSLLVTGADSLLQGVFLSVLSGAIPAAVLHAALAFPVVHPLVLRRRVVLGLYALGALNGALQIGAWSLGWWGPFRHIGTLSTALLFASVVAFILRAGALSLRSGDPLVAQRARILLAAAVFGAGPPVLATTLRDTTSWFAMDMRFNYWAMALFFVPLGFVSVRQSLVNARAAARRAVILAGVATALTGIGLVLVAVQSYALSLLLFPLLYWWPGFERRLAARLYPERARFPELLQEIGAEMASRATVDELLDVLAGAPERLCGSRSAVAFLFPGVAGPEERLRVAQNLPFECDPPISREILVKLLETTRREILREQIALEPQYTNIERDCYAGFDRLDAELLLPVLRDKEVIGGLAIGPQQSGDPYEPPEISALSSVSHQLVQALARVEALGRLQAHENEFEELKQFFPPHIIDRIRERGDAPKLRTQRKLVTVFFADLRGFTSFSEGVEPEEVMNTLAEYHERMGARIAEYGGTLERFVGDGFMVFFNDPLEQRDHVLRATQMALAMQGDMDLLTRRWKARGYAIDAGMGIHTGYATVGFIGYEGRRDYAVIGNVTNLASRLSDAANGGEVLVSGSVRSELGDDAATEAAGTLELKGISRPQPVYRLLTRESATATVGG